MKENYGNKSITPVDKYEVKISKELQEMAEVELRETEEIRTNAIAAIREWAMKNPRINKLRLDSIFLLRFLRHKKFSIPMAQDSIEKYTLLRKYSESDVYPFQKMDFNLPSMLNLLNEGYIFALPKRDALGRRVIFYRAGAYKPSINMNYELLKLHGIVYETLLEDEENQIRGCVHIVDSTGFGFSFLTVFTPQEAVRIARNCETLLPMRHKEIHGINVHPSLKYVLDFGLALMSKKLRSRVKVYSKFDEMKDVDKDLLPLEYGGKIPMKDMIESFKLELKAHQDILLKHDQMNVNAEMYPPGLLKGSVRAVHNPIEAQLNQPQKHSYSGIQGSFRKLDID